MWRAFSSCHLLVQQQKDQACFQDPAVLRPACGIQKQMPARFLVLIQQIPCKACSNRAQRCLVQDPSWIPCRQRHASAACREEAAAEAGFRPPGGSVQDRLSARRQGLCQASNLSTSILEQASLSTLEAFWRWSHTMGISCRHEVLVLHDLKSCEDGSLATCSGRRQPCERSCLAEKGNACDGL